MATYYIDNTIPDALGTYSPSQRDTSGTDTSYNLFADAFALRSAGDTFILRGGNHILDTSDGKVEVTGVTISVYQDEYALIYPNTDGNMFWFATDSGAFDVGEGVIEITDTNPSTGNSIFTSSSRRLLWANSSNFTVSGTTGYLLLNTEGGISFRHGNTANTVSNIRFGASNRTLFCGSGALTLNDCSATGTIEIYSSNAPITFNRLRHLQTPDDSYIYNRTSQTVSVDDSTFVGLAVRKTTPETRFKNSSTGTISVTNSYSSTQLLSLDSEPTYVAGVANGGVVLDATTIARTDTVDPVFASEGKEGTISVIAYDSTVGSLESPDDFGQQYITKAAEHGLKMSWAADDVGNLQAPGLIPRFLNTMNDWVSAGHEILGAGVAGDNFDVVELDEEPFQISTTDTNATLTVANNGTSWTIASDQLSAVTFDTTLGTTNQYLAKVTYGVLTILNSSTYSTWSVGSYASPYDDMPASVVEDGVYNIASTFSGGTPIKFNASRYYAYEFDYARDLITNNTNADPTGYFFYQSGNTELTNAYSALAALNYTYAVSQYPTADGLVGRQQTLAAAQANPLNIQKGYSLDDSDQAFRSTSYTGADDAADEALIRTGLRKLIAYTQANELFVTIQLTHYPEGNPADGNGERLPNKAKWHADALGFLMEEAKDAPNFNWLTVKEAIFGAVQGVVSVLTAQQQAYLAAWSVGTPLSGRDFGTTRISGAGTLIGNYINWDHELENYNYTQEWKNFTKPAGRDFGTRRIDENGLLHGNYIHTDYPEED